MVKQEEDEPPISITSDDEETGVDEETGGNPGAKPRKKNRWTKVEEDALKAGVEEYGKGQYRSLF